ncbi:MAG: HDOD domain-containing protein [Deltaproteobacteria bacterium]|nr:HDOD domain-containing protein [Deltaproteobacteria bacterium]
MGVTKSGEKIEDKAFSSVSLKLVKAVPLFRKFLKDIAPKIYIPDVSYEILKAFSNIDVTAEKVADFLKANPYYQYEFLKMIESKGMREELPSMDAAVILLGMQNSRDLIVSMQLLKTTKGLWPEWDKDGKLKLNPPDILKYALKTEEYLNSFKYEYADMGYVGGLFFDVLALIAVDYAKDKKKVLEYIENIYNHGFQTAKIGLELIKTIPSVSYSKYFFAACLTHDVGKIILALIEPDYFQFCDLAAKKGLPRIIQNFVEQQKYGVSHHLLGATACHYFRLFKPIEKAILYHHHPFLLKNARKGLYQLSSLICLSTNIASNFKKPEPSSLRNL